MLLTRLSDLVHCLISTTTETTEVLVPSAILDINFPELGYPCVIYCKRLSTVLLVEQITMYYYYLLNIIKAM